MAEKNTLYRCPSRLVEHKNDLFKFLVRRWGELFGAEFDLLLYDPSSTYFETDESCGPTTCTISAAAATGEGIAGKSSLP